MIDFILQQFNTREIAVICWLFVFILWAFFQENIRKSFFGVLKSLFQIKILSVIIAAIIYTGFTVLLLSKIGIWEWTLLKDTVYWFIAVAFVLLINANKANQEKGFFITILNDNLKIILVLEFILTLYTFNLIAEIILVPIFVFISAMSTVSELKKDYLPVKNLFDFILSIIGIFFIVFAIVKVFGDFQHIMTSQNLKTLILPPLLTVAFIPFIYLFALIMAYETLFVRISIFNKNDPDLIKFTKHKIILACHLNLLRLNRFAKESSQDLMRVKTREDVINMVMKK